MERAQRGTSKRRSSSGLPWSRILLIVAVAGPPLWIGGAPPSVVPVFLVVVALLWNRLCTRSTEPLRVPWVAVLGAVAVLATLLQWLPLGARSVLAPGLEAEISSALAQTRAGGGVRAWSGLCPTPGDAALELARLLGLVALCVAAAQLSWRSTAAAVAGAGAAVALVGFAHEAAGMDTIYGTYRPLETQVRNAAALLGPFVNPNHQSGLLLLGVFAAGGLAADLHRLGLETRDPSKVERYGDRFLAAMAALTIQLPALVLSLSRGAIVSLVLVGPVALWLGLARRSPRRSEQRRRSKQMSPMRVIVMVGMASLLLLVAQHGAWRELSTLTALADPDAEVYAKIRMVEDAPALIGLSPALGIGPGAFVDLFPTVDSQPTHLVFTHLESAPLALVVRWGPAVGGIVVLGLGAWWVAAMIHGGRRQESRARRIVLLGVLALGLQNLGDFSLEFLGVAAPAAALVGALGPPRWLTWRASRARWAMGAALLVATLSAFWWIPATWTYREARNEKMLDGELPSEVLLRERPLDGRLHGLLAREAAEAGAWEQAHARAIAATHLRPGSIDAWLLRAAAETEAGEIEAADRSMRRGLGLLRSPPDEALIGWLLKRYPRPADMVPVAPAADQPWQRLVVALISVAPEHADALAAARSRAHPEDPMPLRIRGAIALRRGNPALALHHARLLRQLAPADATSHVAVVAALRAFRPPRHVEARDALEQALERGDLRDPKELALLQEELLRTLVRLGDPASLQRARKLADALMKQPATRAVRRRWEALATELAEAETVARSR